LKVTILACVDVVVVVVLLEVVVIAEADGDVVERVEVGRESVVVEGSLLEIWLELVILVVVALEVASVVLIAVECVDDINEVVVVCSAASKDVVCCVPHPVSKSAPSERHRRRLYINGDPFERVRKNRSAESQGGAVSCAEN
jgi:hypothetical protein